jgi:hypothetical protein
MKLIDDIDTFEPKASKILTCGLSPICNHTGFDQADFCCLNCQNLLFDKSDLIKEDRTFLIFRKPIDTLNLEFWFDGGAFIPRTALDCKFCGFYIGFLSLHGLSDEKTFHVITRNVFLKLKSNPDLENH